MQVSRIILVFIAFFILPGHKSEANERSKAKSDYSNTLQFVDREIQRIMRRNHLPGFAITIVDDQDILYEKEYGLIDIENNLPVTKSSVFKLLSVSKVFTALEIFREVEEGILDLDAPVKDYLPGFVIKSRFEGEREITLKDLLAHRSGLPRNEGLFPVDYVRVDYMLDKFEYSTSELFKAYPTGSRYKYSNLNYDLLGRIIEETRGESYYKYMQDEVLKKLGMANSAFHSSIIDDSLSIAKGYEYFKRKYHPFIQYDINNAPSGNLYSTIDDLSAFLKTIFRNKFFAARSTMGEMFRDLYSNPEDPETMGLGWKTTTTDNNELLAWHDGGPTEGIGSMLAFLPERKIGIAVIGNETSFSGYYSVQFATAVLSRMLEDRDLITSSELPVRTIDSQKIKPAKQMEGKYAAFGSIMDIKFKGNKLKSKIGRIGMNLIPVNKTEFAVTNWMHKIGLTKLFRPQIDIDKIRIRFINASSVDSCYMIINVDNLSHEICPRLKHVANLMNSYSTLPGEYSIAPRLAGNVAGKRTKGMVSIIEQDGVFIQSEPYGPIEALDSEHLLILSGPFAGETMEYKPESGMIFHQTTALIPELAID